MLVFDIDGRPCQLFAIFVYYVVADGSIHNCMQLYNFFFGAKIQLNIKSTEHLQYPCPWRYKETLISESLTTCWEVMWVRLNLLNSLAEVCLGELQYQLVISLVLLLF